MKILLYYLKAILVSCLFGLVMTAGLVLFFYYKNIAPYKAKEDLTHVAIGADYLVWNQLDSDGQPEFETIWIQILPGVAPTLRKRDGLYMVKRDALWKLDTSALRDVRLVDMDCYHEHEESLRKWRRRYGSNDGYYVDCRKVNRAIPVLKFHNLMIDKPPVSPFDLPDIYPENRRYRTSFNVDSEILGSVGSAFFMNQCITQKEIYDEREITQCYAYIYGLDRGSASTMEDVTRNWRWEHDERFTELAWEALDQIEEEAADDNCVEGLDTVAALRLVEVRPHWDDKGIYFGYRFAAVSPEPACSDMNWGSETMSAVVMSDTPPDFLAGSDAQVPGIVQAYWSTHKPTAARGWTMISDNRDEIWQAFSTPSPDNNMPGPGAGEDG